MAGASGHAFSAQRYSFIFFECFLSLFAREKYPFAHLIQAQQSKFELRNAHPVPSILFLYILDAVHRIAYLAWKDENAPISIRLQQL